MKYYIFIISFLIFNKLSTQDQKSIPGYLGSRNLVSFKYMTNLSVSDQIAYQIRKPTLVLSYERVSSRKNSFTFTAGMSGGTFDHYAYYTWTENRSNNLFITSNNTAYPLKEVKGFINYSRTHLSISKSYYMQSQGAISPNGKYFKLGLGYDIFKIKSDNMEYRIFDGVTFFANPGDKKFKLMSYPSLILEFGSKRFLTNHVFFQKAITFNFPATFYSSASNKDFYNIDDYNESFLALYLPKTQTFNVSLSLGYAF